MALTYKFIQGLQSLLTSDWKAPMQARISWLNSKLLTSPEEMLDLEKTKSPKPFSEKQLEKKLEGYTTKLAKWENEKQDLEQCIERNEFKIGIEPIVTITDAKLLLAHSHILRVDTDEYNAESVSALSNMLSNNFTELLDPEVARQHLERTSYEVDSMNVVIEKLLSSKPVIFDDIIPVEEQDDLSEDDRTSIQAIINSFSYIDLELLQYASDKMKFFEKFYRTNSNKVFSSIAISLSFLFSNKVAVDEFLLRHVDFTSPESVEQNASIFSENYKPARNIDADTRLLWKELNAKHGPKSIELFLLAEDLSAIEGFDLHKIVDEIGGIENQKVIERIKTFAEQLSYYQGEDKNAIKLDELCRKYKISQNVFEDAVKNILPKAKSSDLLPDIKFSFQVDKKEYSFEKLKAGDILGLVVGKAVGCCQFIGGLEHESAVSGFTREEAGFYAISRNGKILAQTYAWIGSVDGKNVVVWNSFEFLPGKGNLFLGAAQEFSRLIKEESGGAASEGDFHDLYVGARGKIKLSGGPCEGAVLKATDDLHISREADEALYKITSDTTLFVDQVSNQDFTFDNYEEYVALCQYQSSLNLIEYIEGLDIEISHNIKFHLLKSANLNWLLISEGVLTREKLLEFNDHVGLFDRFSTSDPATLEIVRAILEKFSNSSFDELREVFLRVDRGGVSSIQVEQSVIKAALEGDVPDQCQVPPLGDSDNSGAAAEE